MSEAESQPQVPAPNQPGVPAEPPQARVLPSRAQRRAGQHPFPEAPAQPHVEAGTHPRTPATVQYPSRRLTLHEAPAADASTPATAPAPSSTAPSSTAPSSTPQTQTQNLQIPSRDQSKPAAAATIPKPPPSTLRSNLIGILAGVFVAPIAMIFLIWGCSTIMETSYNGSIAAVLLGIFEIAAGISMLAVTGVVTGYYSSLSWAVSALWPVGFTALASVIRSLVASHNDSLTGVSDDSLWWEFLRSLSTLTASGLFPTVAIIMVSASLASQVAYMEGRDYAKREYLLMESVDRSPGEPVAPPSRMKAHIVSVLVSVFCVIGGMLALIPLHDRLAVITGAAGHTADLPTALTYGLPLLGIVLLFIAVYTGSRSAAGLFFSGIFCGVIPGIVLSFGDAATSGWSEQLVDFLAEHLTATMSISGGPLTAFGGVLLACGMTLYWCRQSGRKDEMADIAAANS